MFRGINNATLDAKGRLALPARFRETMLGVSSGKMVLTIDMREPCLLLYPAPEWDDVQRKLEEMDNIGARVRRLQRLLIGHATDLDLDSNGRLLVPQMLREYADLSKRLVLVGQSNKVEIWNEKNWRGTVESWLSEDNKDFLDEGDEFTGLRV